MPPSASHFLRSESGSLAPILAIMLIPMTAALGFSIDYNSAVATRASMQNALDAATLSITTLPTSTSLADRQVKLQESFAANSGQGTAKLDGFVVAADGTASINASARFAMPTNFMQIAHVDTVPVAVASAVRKRPALVETTFKVDKISGYWDKSMTLYGTKFGETAANKLMKISYVHNKYGDPKGYGTSRVYTINGSTETLAQKQVCTTRTVTSFYGLPTTTITQTDSSGKKYATTCVNTMYPSTGAGAVIDVSLMDKLYLEMKIPNPNPGLGGGYLPTGTKQTLRSDDTATSDRLYIDSVEVKQGQVVDIFIAVPCGQPSTQAWEDGGNAVPAPVSNADFFYTVTGKCDFNKRPSQTVLTQ
ncbi:TadE/TadG family type IV pilus assembly protein [Mesorhizobium onobrychidis]|uniref:Pilus assembly protein n=1 Tax=Mesorhizobium onobrychidis TaxID=2775404 RepID=A0ABY5QZX8_9HYPH|nr:TadE/TadG family type IV pilus assembly protein [Mesorhizobium onobrychidis]UVC16211.1 pilus assembly protein [Mesorhizobium onobrychidis]